MDDQQHDSDHEQNPSNLSGDLSGDRRHSNPIQSPDNNSTGQEHQA
jgi:hypothetical protein